MLAVGSINAAVYTSPHATPALDPLPALLAVINKAKQTLHLSAYSFTLVSVADAIIAAHARGVVVRGIADRQQAAAASSQVPRLAAAGIDLHVWGSQYALTHEKALIVDADTKNATVTLGSLNFSQSALTSNVEVLLVCKGTQVSKVLAPTLVAQQDAAYAKGKPIA